MVPVELAFPRRPNRFAASGFNTVMWAGPDDWLVIAEKAGTELLGSLDRAFAGHNAAIVETSGNRSRFGLAGPGAKEMMARACALDFDAPHFEAGHCSGTLVARAQAYVLQRSADPSYEVIVRRSYAQYLREWFGAAGCKIV